VGDLPVKGDFIILTPAYALEHSPHLGGIDTELYHLCRATRDADEVFVGLDILTSEETQAMCEALACSAKGNYDLGSLTESNVPA